MELIRLFDGFNRTRIKTTGATINLVHGGQGPPVLLLHGYPQTHVMWHKVAARLAQEFAVVIADLRGYGDSSKPPDDDDHSTYSKRAMAQDQVEVMSHVGFDKFAVVGHDRGGRVAHRMALDHSERITKIAVLDIVPTYKLYDNVSKAFATAASIDLVHDAADLNRKITCPVLALWAEKGAMPRMLEGS